MIQILIRLQPLPENKLINVDHFDRGKPSSKSNHKITITNCCGYINTYFGSFLIIPLELPVDSSIITPYLMVQYHLFIFYV